MSRIRLSGILVAITMIAGISHVNSATEQVEGASQASIEQWDFSCVDVSEFSKIDGGGDDFKLNNFVVKEGSQLGAPNKLLTGLEIAFSVTNRTSKNVAWSAEFLGFGKDKLPSFAMSASPPAEFSPPEQTRTFGTRIQVRTGTLARTGMICLRITGDR